MNNRGAKTLKGEGKTLYARIFYEFMVPRAYSVIMFVALFCTLAVKFFHACRYGLINEYPGWILSDVPFLLGAEVFMAIICFIWRKKWVVRICTIAAAVICTWSVLNAGWLIRTGTQILPRVLLPLFRAPLNALSIIGVNLIKMPIAAIALLAPSAVALTFFFYVLIKTRQPVYNRRRFFVRVSFSIIIVVLSVFVRISATGHNSPRIGSVGLKYNSQLKAVVSLFLDKDVKLPTPVRMIPSYDQVKVTIGPERMGLNVVLVVLEGVQYRYTSFSSERNNLTPFLESLAGQGVVFENARSSLSHTTKALFALLTGRFPSASQDIAEAVPVPKPYASIATILREKLGYRTAFFQSAMGDFESRPGLVSNLGFERFIAREETCDPNSYVGYLGCDEFAMLGPVVEWIKSEQSPFFMTYLCSVTHDPYEIPGWFCEPAKEKIDQYKQTIFYTDKFLAALDVELSGLNLAENTIVCVIGDHGEAFGEHGQLGHALIHFDEVLHIPFCIRAPFLIDPGTKVEKPVSSVDLTPTLLSLLGFQTEEPDFDGINVLGEIPDDRKVFFSGWMQEGPAGFVQGNRKVIYNPTDKIVYLYDLKTDPFELIKKEIPEQEAAEIAGEITAWRQSTILKINQVRTGRKILFDQWLCRWNNRDSSAKYINP